MARPLGEPAWVPARRERSRPPLRRWIGPLVLLLIAGTAVVLLGGLTSAAQPPAGGQSPSPTASQLGVGGPSVGGASPALHTAAGSPSPMAPPSPTPSPLAPASLSPAWPLPSPDPATGTTPPPPTRPPNAAPASAAEFDLEQQVIDIGFPFADNVRYRYRDNWLDRRPGAPEHYNHAYGRRRGELRRAHDGIDLYVARGAPVRAPFAGLVIDPAGRWQPWDPERYGETVVIVSQEPASAGYAALLSHLEVGFVLPGDVVRRGEVIGLAGDSGNAEGIAVHLHFELRAPFRLEWDEAGETRHIDAFNPYHSLLAADPRSAD